MPRNEDFDNAFWSEPEVEALSANATLLYVWSWTNLRCGMAGMYTVSVQRMTESKVALADIPAALEELSDAGFAFYEESVLWVRARVKRLRSRTPQIAKSIANDVQKIPVVHPLRRRFLETYGEENWLRDALDGVAQVNLTRTSSEPHPNPNNTGGSVNLTRTSPEVPRSGAGLTSGPLSGTEETSTEKVQLPDDFPDELRAHLKAVFKVLRDLAVRHHAKAVAPLSLVSLVMARQHKPLVRAAYDFAAWSDGQAQQRKDVLSGYRNWLDKTDDLAGYEELTTAGLPGSVGGALVPMPSGRFSEYDKAAGL